VKSGHQQNQVQGHDSLAQKCSANTEYSVILAIVGP